MAPERRDHKAAYDALRKKHALPTYDALLAEYDLDAIGETRFLLRDITKKMLDRTDAFRKILEGLLSPEGIAEMQEADALGPSGSEEISALIRTLMRLDRELLIAELDNTENAYAAYIAHAHPEWLRLKPRIQAIAERLAAYWKSSGTGRQQPHYLG